MAALLNNNFFQKMFSKIRRISRIASKIEDAAKNQQNAPRFITTEEVINRENKYAAHNYHPLPVALSKGQGKQLISFIIGCASGLFGI